MLTICTHFNNFKLRRNLSIFFFRKTKCFTSSSHRVLFSPPTAVPSYLPAPARSCLRAFAVAVLTARLSPHRTTQSSPPPDPSLQGPPSPSRPSGLPFLLLGCPSCHTVTAECTLHFVHTYCSVLVCPATSALRTGVLSVHCWTLAWTMPALK